jgi:SAM-dependent methyltransferase
MKFRLSLKFIFVIALAYLAPQALSEEKTASPQPSSVVERSPSVTKALPIATGVQEYWRFLHERAREEGKSHPKRVFTDNRMKNNDYAVQQALAYLDGNQGLVTGRALVLGGASETNLDPLLKAFSEVHVADLSLLTLQDVAAKYAPHPNAKRLFLHQVDLSGIPADYQMDNYNKMIASGKGEKPTPDTVSDYYKNFPNILNKLEFSSGKFDLVLSLVLAEYLPYGPVVAAFEKVRAEKRADRKGIDELIGGEPFFYRPEVMEVFEEVLMHHRDELNRLVAPTGIIAFSCWMRPDEKQATLAKEVKTPLLRVGDDRMTEATWKKFFDPFKKAIPEKLESNIGPNPLSTLNLFFLVRR